MSRAQLDVIAAAGVDSHCRPGNLRLHYLVLPATPIIPKGVVGFCFLEVFFLSSLFVTHVWTLLHEDLETQSNRNLK